jgi:cytochrome c oxidase cbb3-type subunit III
VNRAGLFAAALAFSASLAGLAQQPAPPAPPPVDVPRFGIVEYPSRKPGDPAAIERGATLYGVSCRFCHGADLRGGDGGGPNLLRSTVVLEDDQGERIGPVLEAGRGSMPPFKFTPDQTRDVATYLHSFQVTSRNLPSDINIVVGDAKAGARYVAEACGACHATEKLAAFANNPRLSDPKILQQMWLMPGFAGRGVPPISPPITRAVVTVPPNQRIEGELVRMDDFTISVRLADGAVRTFSTAGTKTTVEILDPLAPHKTLLSKYTDADIHNVTAYLVSLRSAR